MTTKKNILVLIDWYVPGYKAGGPIRSCSNLVMQLKKYFNFRIITRDTDLNAEKPYDNIVSNEWSTIHNDVPIHYLSKNNVNFSNIKKVIFSQDYDMVYLNSFFSFYFTILPLFILKGLKRDKKIILATRGMLSKQALNIKPLKKKIFIAFAKLSGLYSGITFHASSEFEKEDVLRIMGAKANVIIGPNLPKPVSPEKLKRKKMPHELKLVYLSRVHPIKNLDKALDYLYKIDKLYKVDFDIYGPIENNNYWTRCKQLIAMLPSNIKCSYKNEVHHEQTAEVYKKYHFSILPSESENYGHSIVESFVASCPVIISDATPWRQLKNSLAGFDISLNNPDDFVSALEEVCEMPQTEYDKWLEGTFDYANRIIDDKEKIEQNKKLFETA